MLKSLTLKCENCNANLEISPDTEKFSCGYCGASQIVQRSGGTVSLKLVTDAIKQVQAGTDKTAAELAIRRLKDELNQIDSNYAKLNSQMNSELGKNSNAYLFGTILATVIALCNIVSEYVWIYGLVWIIIIAVIATSWLTNQHSIRTKYEPDLQAILDEYQTTEKKINLHKEIVDN